MPDFDHYCSLLFLVCLLYDASCLAGYFNLPLYTDTINHNEGKCFEKFSYVICGRGKYSTDTVCSNGIIKSQEKNYYVSSEDYT